MLHTSFSKTFNKLKELIKLINPTKVKKWMLSMPMATVKNSNKLRLFYADDVTCRPLSRTHAGAHKHTQTGSASGKKSTAVYLSMQKHEIHSRMNGIRRGQRVERPSPSQLSQSHSVTVRPQPESGTVSLALTRSNFSNSNCNHPDHHPI